MPHSNLGCSTSGSTENCRPSMGLIAWFLVKRCTSFMLNGNNFGTWTPRSSWAMASLLIPMLTHCGGQSELISIERSSGGSTNATTGGSTGLSGITSAGSSVLGATTVNLGAQSLSDCKLPPDPGTCSTGVQRYYFDPKTSSCLRFTYSGCGGNGNNFLTQSQCTVFCQGGLSCSCSTDSKDCSTAFGCASCSDVSTNGCVPLAECRSPGLSCLHGGTYSNCIAADSGSSFWACQPAFD